VVRAPEHPSWWTGPPQGRCPDYGGKLTYAAHLRDSGHTIADIVAKTGITRTTLYRYLPPRPPDPITAASTDKPMG
jgi:hypothetical protein